ncbi:MAG TPA: type II toxin-antitoxin system VapC family toxin [Caulobacteraceae bacterium]|jgi:ribonuclease VapC
MVVDSSAIMAILLGEPDAERIAFRLATERQPLISAANFVEAGQVYVQRQRFQPEESLARYNAFLEDNGIAITAVDEAQARVALDARIKFGRGFGHPARLNYSDCFAYALAKTRNLPLLFKGDDFTHTDIVSALV